MSNLRDRIESDELLFDSAIVSHGYASHLRDYDVVVEVPAAKPDGSGESYIEGRYLYRFTHCVEAHVVTAVTDETWPRSWDDHFTDYQAWEGAGAPEGFVWGVNWANAYPGLSYVDGSELAKEWSTRLDHDMHEVAIETNTFLLRLVCHDLRIKKLAIR